MVNAWKKRWAHMALALVVAGGAATAQAQAKTKTVSWIVPAPPGGALDATGRMLAQKLSEALDTHIVVENRPGGGGVVAAEYILNNSRADTIHILEATQTMAGVIDQMVPGIRCKPIEDLLPVHGLCYLPAVLVAPADAPFNNTKELVEYSRKQEGGLNLGTTGPGGVGHFYTSQYMKATGLNATLVHYKGSSPAMQDLLGGNFHAMFDFMATARTQIESGRLKPITVMAENRLPSLPDVPTVTEDGYAAALMTGMYATSAILAALHQRTRSGRGQYLDISLMDSIVSLMSYLAMNYFVGGKLPERLGNGHPNIVPYEVFPCLGGHLILAVGNEAQYRNFCAAVGRPDLAEHEDYSDMGRRLANKDSLIPILQEIMLTKTVPEWISLLRGKGVPCGPINTIPQVFEDLHVQHRELKVDIPHPTGQTVPSLRSPMRMSDSPIDYQTAPPMLGQHTDEILLRYCDVSQEELLALKKSGVV